MPTYEYACSACGEHLEVVQSFSDDALTECPACGGALRKVFAPVGIVLKGSGFYRTDSRAPAAKTTTSDRSSSEDKTPATSSETTTKSDSAKSDSASKDSGASSDSAKPTQTAAAG